MGIFAKYKLDLFICHASEDKEDIIELLFKSLEEHKLKAGYDKAIISEGDIIHHEIIGALNESRVLVVVFSKAFFKAGKSWPWIEIGAFLKKKNYDRIIPLQYEITDNEIKDADIPNFLLTNRREVITQGNINERTLGISKKIKQLKFKRNVRIAFFLIPLLILLGCLFLLRHQSIQKDIIKTSYLPVGANNDSLISAIENLITEAKIKKLLSEHAKPNGDSKKVAENQANTMSVNGNNNTMRNTQKNIGSNPNSIKKNQASIHGNYNEVNNNQENKE